MTQSKNVAAMRPTPQAAVAPRPTPQAAVAMRSPGPRQPVMQITAPESPWKAEAERWYGTPYRYGGNDANGFDCSGFAAELYNRVAGMSLPRTSEAQFRVGRDVSQDDMRPGDLVFFRSPNSSAVTHVGVYIGGSYFTHASTSRGVTFNSTKESYYRNNFHGARRVVGVQVASLSQSSLSQSSVTSAGGPSSPRQPVMQVASLNQSFVPSVGGSPSPRQPVMQVASLNQSFVAPAGGPSSPRQPVMQITAPESPWKAEAERCYGTPYSNGGNDANGFDCPGFAAELYNRVAGMSLPRTSEAQFRVGRDVSQDDMRPGDLVFFRSPNSSAVTHVGVYIGGSYFTHASTSRGVTFNSIKESYYRNNFYGARRVVGG